MHSVWHYTFARADDYIDELCEKINAFDEESLNFQGSHEVVTSLFHDSI